MTTQLPLSGDALTKSLAYINGEWLAADGSAVFDVLNPATGEIIAAVPDMGAAETNRAIDAASAALTGWRAITAKERSAVLRRWFDLINEHRDELAALITREQGKPLSEALGEIGYGASYIEWYAEEAKRIYGDVIPSTGADRRFVVLKQPIGVVAAITPWNFPLAMITRKCAPALAAGCTIVLKPAEATPLSALAIAALAEQAGIPAGVLNVVTASRGDEVGKALCAHADVRKLSFTGSTAVGKLLLKQAADTVKKVSMELGGNAPFIVFDDADVNEAVKGAMLSKFRNTGQTCICANRFLVQAGVYDEFVQKLTAAVSKLTVGNGMDDGVEQGPLINQAALSKAERLLTDATSAGATLLTGGKLDNSGGTFLQPAVLSDVNTDMAIAKEEIFAPIAPVYKFDNDADAIALANNTQAGLAAYFYSRDIARIWQVAETLEYGMVGINTGVISSEAIPFGGVKESGIGREGSHYGLDEFLEMKYVCMAGLDR